MMTATVALPAVADHPAEGPNHVPGAPCLPGDFPLEATGRILRYDDMLKELDQIERTSGGLVTLHSAGQSGLGRDLPYAKIGSGPETFLVWGRIHGAEWVGTEAILTLLKRLSRSDPVARRIRQEISLVAFPMVNPDGSEAGQRRDVVHNIDLNRDWVTPDSPQLPGSTSFVAAESQALYELYITERPDWVVDIHTMGPSARVLPETNDLVNMALGTAHEVGMTPEQLQASEQMGQVALEGLRKLGKTHVSRWLLSVGPDQPAPSALLRMMFDGRGPLGAAGPSHTPKGGFFYEARDPDGLAHGYYETLITRSLTGVLDSIASGEIAGVDASEFAALPFHETVPCGNAP